MLANAWSWEHSTSTTYTQALPGVVRVHVGPETFVVPSYLMVELEAACTPGTIRGMFTHDMYLKQNTMYFHEILLLLKLRWLLRLHSACCEIDYKMCSLKNIIMGLHYVSLQHVAEAESDSIFQQKVLQQVAELNLHSVLDDIMDQIQRALGKSATAFINFAHTCEVTRCVHASQMDSTLTTPQVVANDILAVALDTSFLSHFMRVSRRERASRLRELYDDLESLGIPLPDVPPLAGARNLRDWARARTHPSRTLREKAAEGEFDKLAQLDALLLTVSVELHSSEVMASPEDCAPQDAVANTQVLAKVAPRDTAPEPADFGILGQAPGLAGPPSARVILYDKPQLAPSLFEAAVDCVHHHLTFPQGIRERVCGLIMEEYGLTEEQSERMAVAATQNIDGVRLSEATLLQMAQREKTRLSLYAAVTGKDTSHLLVPSLTPPPIEKGKPPKFMQSRPVPDKLPFASAFTSVDMTRSLPDFRGFSVHGSDRAPFKVQQAGGPLTLDPTSRGKLQNTGYFIRMPPLKGGNDR